LIVNGDEIQACGDCGLWNDDAAVEKMGPLGVSVFFGDDGRPRVQEQPGVIEPGPGGALRFVTPSTPHFLTRTRAAALIDRVREIEARQRGTDEGVALAILLDDFGLSPLEQCPGEAHSNGHIDHCSRCKPGWGYVGRPVKVR